MRATSSTRSMMAFSIPTNELLPDSFVQLCVRGTKLKGILSSVNHGTSNSPNLQFLLTKICEYEDQQGLDRITDDQFYIFRSSEPNFTEELECMLARSLSQAFISETLKNDVKSFYESLKEIRFPELILNDPNSDDEIRFYIMGVLYLLSKANDNNSYLNAKNYFPLFSSVTNFKEYTSLESLANIVDSSDSISDMEMELRLIRLYNKSDFAVFTYAGITHEQVDAVNRIGVTNLQEVMTIIRDVPSDWIGKMRPLDFNQNLS